jgi:hypothetical protein
MKRQRNLRKAKFSTKHGLTTRAGDRRHVAPDAIHSRRAHPEEPQGLAMERIAVLHDLTVSLRRMLGLPNQTR